MCGMVSHLLHGIVMCCVMAFFFFSFLISHGGSTAVREKEGRKESQMKKTHDPVLLSRRKMAKHLNICISQRQHFADTSSQGVNHEGIGHYTEI